MASGSLRRRWGPRRAERGASLVEFALVLPLLSMFLFGIVQFGLAYDKQQSINSAAREGARTGAIPDTTRNEIDQAVQDSFLGADDSWADNNGSVSIVVVDSANVDVGAGDPPCEGQEGNTIIVTASVDHVLTIPFVGAPTLTLKGEGEFRCERLKEEA